MAVTGNTELGATKNDLIISLVQKELAFRSQLLDKVTDFSSYVGKGMKSIKVPKLDSFTVVDRASAAAGAATVLTSGEDTIDLDKNAFVSWLVDSSDEVQSSMNVQLENIMRATQAHARYIDSQIIAVLDAAAGLDIGAAPLTTALILNAREELIKNFADMSQVFMAVGPDQEKVLLGLSEFSRADYYGTSNIPNGVIGRVYGMPVIVHQGISTGKAYFWEKSGVGFARQLKPSLAEQPEIEYGSSAKRVVLDQLFGVAGLQLGQLGKLATESPLIVKM